MRCYRRELPLAVRHGIRNAFRYVCAPKFLPHPPILSRMQSRQLDLGDRGVGRRCLLRAQESFVRDAWTAPLFVTGFNQDGARIWEEWAGWSLDSWRTCHTSFPFYSNVGAPLERLGGLLDENAKSTLRMCVHWYVEANSGKIAVESGIVRALTALERLVV